MKFALEHQNPSVAGPVISKKAGGVYPETGYSLLTVKDPNVLLWALKAHDDGIIDKGMVVRLWNVSNIAVQTEIVPASAVAYRLWRAPPPAPYPSTSQANRCRLTG